MEVPIGWYEVLRAPRPPPGQLLLVVSISTKSPAQGKRVPKNDPVLRPPPVRVSPEAATEAARAVVRSRDQCFGGAQTAQR